jgi:hypothetical protein
MNRIKWFKPLWWLLHIIVIALLFFLGGSVLF